MAITVRLLDAPMKPGAMIGPFTNAHPGLGGVCTFVGEVRGGEGAEALELLHYARMTLPGMEALAERANTRFGLMGLLMLHRTGNRCPGEQRKRDGGGRAPKNGKEGDGIHRGRFRSFRQ